MLLKENDVAKANNTVRSEEISSEIWFIALSYPSLSSLHGRAARRGERAKRAWGAKPRRFVMGTTPRTTCGRAALLTQEGNLGCAHWLESPGKSGARCGIFHSPLSRFFDLVVQESDIRIGKQRLHSSIGYVNVLKL